MFRKIFKKYLFALRGPTIYRIPSHNPNGSSMLYEPNHLESVSSTIIQIGNTIFAFCKWICIFCFPLIIPKIYDAGVATFLKPIAVYSLLHLTAVFVRGMGRMINPDYRKFIELYNIAEKERTDSSIEKVTLYAFSSTWPVKFDVRNLSSTLSLKNQVRVASRLENQSIILWPITWFIARTIGICLVYPGCTWLINSRTLEMRLNNRDYLRRLYSLKLVGLNTRDGEFVETFYADRRCSPSNPEHVSGHGDSKGEILILCCEGNGGYPEVGVPLVPLELGYSILAWNHPGFGQSTGSPFPRSEQNAVEAVMLFALEQLKFPPNQIYLYGWSIGGYAASWCAMNFPDIGGLILDATFDDLDELTRRAMPDFFYPLAIASLHNHLDLNNVPNVNSFDGPIRLIRRGEDEIISTTYPPTRDSNRGNFLLIKILKHRFPHLMTPENKAQLEEYLSLDSTGHTAFLESLELSPDQVGESVCDFLKQEVRSRSHVLAHGSTPDPSGSRIYPSELGAVITDQTIKQSMLFYLVARYFSETPTSHCAPLNPAFFKLPWSPLDSSPVHRNTHTNTNSN